VTRSLVLLISLVLGACAGLVVAPPADCAALCDLAHDCGFLPSNLGHGATAEASRADCLRLCGQSPADEPAIATLLECLRSTGDDGWCDDPDDDAYELGQQCAAVVTCANRAFPDAAILGSVDLEVALVTFDGFVSNYGAEALAALYIGGPKDTKTCAPALCSPMDCGHEEDDDTSPCDRTMCGNGMFQIGKTCDDLAATSVDLIASQDDSVVSQVILDDTSGSSCKTAAATFDAATYNLRPGPVRTAARIAGTLPARELARIGYPDAAADDDTPVDYCLRFAGMHVQARSGDSYVLVPVGNIDMIAAYFPDNPRPGPCTQ
jgi:hypothetical protein